MIVRIERKSFREPFTHREVIYWRIVRFDTKTGEWEFIGAESTRYKAVIYCKEKGIDLSKVEIVR